MADAVLSRAQRNSIFEIIRAHELDPADFQWAAHQNNDNEPVEVLTHAPTEGRIEISHFDSGWWLAWFPCVGRSRRHESAASWEVSGRYLSDWLLAVHADHRAPDLWGELSKATTISDAADKPEYLTPFSPVELKQLESGLADLEHYITATQPLDPAGKQEVHRHFTYLLEAAKRGASKIDWLNIFVGQMVAMITTGLLDARVYSSIMSHAATALNAVFKFGLKLLG